MTTLDVDIPTAEVFDPLLAPHRYKGAHGGRGSGKSIFFAGLMLEECASGEKDAVCLREIQNSLDESVKKLLATLIEQHNLHDLFEIQDRRILCPGGRQIIFQGLQNHTADSIKSLQGYSIAWVEEAQSISQRSLKILRPTIREPGSELWFSWNPVSEDDPVEMLVKDPPRDCLVVEANYRDNPWFPDVLRDEMEEDRRRDFDSYLHVWEGHYQKMSSALIYKNWRVEDFEAPDGAEFRFGLDWGFANDPTAVLRCFSIGKKLYIDYEAQGEGVPVDILPDFLSALPDIHRWPIIADNARPELIDYCVSHGYPLMVPCQKGKGSVEDGIDFVRSYDVVIHPRCKHLVKEISNYSYRVDKYTDQVLPVIKDGQADHLLDALRYAVESVRRQAGRTMRTEEINFASRSY